MKTKFEVLINQVNNFVFHAPHIYVEYKESILNRRWFLSHFVGHDWNVSREPFLPICAQFSPLANK